MSVALVVRKPACIWLSMSSTLLMFRMHVLLPKIGPRGRWVLELSFMWTGSLIIGKPASIVVIGTRPTASTLLLLTTSSIIASTSTEGWRNVKSILLITSVVHRPNRLQWLRVSLDFRRISRKKVIKSTQYTIQNVGEILGQWNSKFSKITTI